MPIYVLCIFAEDFAKSLSCIGEFIRNQPQSFRHVRLRLCWTVLAKKKSHEVRVLFLLWDYFFRSFVLFYPKGDPLLFPLLLRGEVGLLVLCGALAVVGERPWRSWRWSSLSGERVPCTLILLLLLVLVLLTRLPDVHEDARALHFAAPEHYVLLHKINAEPQHIGFHIARGTEMMFLIPWALGGITLAKLVNVGLVLTTMLLLHVLVGCLRVESTDAAPGAGWTRPFPVAVLS